MDRELVTREDTVSVRVDVGNIGKRRGDEVVQLYVGYPASAVQRAAHELKAFRRVTLDPRQVTTLALTLPVSELAFGDVTKNDWVVEAGEYVVMAGTSSRDLPRRGSFRVQ